MAGNGDTPHDQRSAEERAEELMERVSGQVSHVVGRVIGRAREEIEDLVAEARTLNAGERGTGSGTAGSGS
jgi:hypothetical protein